jgi:replicative DNA helicase
MESELDYQILAASLYDPEAAPYFKENVKSDDVGKIVGSFGVYQLYKQISACYEEVGEVSVQIFNSWLENTPEIYEGLGGKESYDALMGKLGETNYPSPVTLSKLLRKRGSKIRALMKLDQLKQAISNDDAEEESIDSLGFELQAAIQDNKTETNFNIRTANDIADSTDAIWEEEVFIPTQFPELNEALGYSKTKGGIMRSAIYSIVANSGFGKSTLCKVLCNHWLDNGLSVLFVNCEEPQVHWEKVLMTQVTGVNVYKDIDSNQAAEVDKKFKAKMKEWGDRLMVKHDPESLYYEDLEAWIRRLVAEHPIKPDIVVIDTIQSLFSKGGKARWGEFEQIMVRMEKLAKEMNAAFIIPTQQNNNAIKENRQTINQSDVGGSVTIVQKASVIMVITPRKQDIDLDSFDADNYDGIMEIQIPKNRITGASSGKKLPMVKYDDETKSYIPWNLDLDKQANANMMISLNKLDISPT